MRIKDPHTHMTAGLGSCVKWPLDGPTLESLCNMVKEVAFI